MTHFTTIVYWHFNSISIKSYLCNYCLFCLQPIHLAQSCFQVEAFGRTFTLDLELNQLVSLYHFFPLFSRTLMSVSAFILLQLFSFAFFPRSYANAPLLCYMTRWGIPMWLSHRHARILIIPPTNKFCNSLWNTFEGEPELEEIPDDSFSDCRWCWRCDGYWQCVSSHFAVTCCLQIMWNDTSATTTDPCSLW